MTAGPPSARTAREPHRGLVTGVVIATIALVLAATGALAGYLHSQAEHDAMHDARVAAAAAAAAIQAEMARIDHVVESARVILGAPSADDLAEIAALRDSAPDPPGLVSLYWGRRVFQSQRARFEEEAGRPITDGPGAGVAPSPVRAEYYPVTAVFPAGDGRPVDLLALPGAAAALQAAQRNGHAAVTRAFVDGGERVVALVHPVRAFGAGEASPVVGAVVATIAPARLRAAAADGVSVTDSDGTPLIGPAPAPGTATAEVDTDGRVWTVHVAPAAASMGGTLAAIAAGLAIATLIGVVFLLHRRRQRYAEGLVAQRMAERDLAEADREKEHAEKDAIVDSLQDGLFVLDAFGRIGRVNEPLCALTGFEPDELLGQGFPFPWAPGGADMGEELRMFARLERDGGEIETTIVRRDGQPVDVILTMSPDGRVATMKDVSERRRADRELERRALSDPVTGLLNEFAFRDRLEEVYGIDRPPSERGVLALVQVDGFAEVNEERGWDVGDVLLAEVADRLALAVGLNDDVARLGGGTFGVFMAGADADGAQDLVESIRDGLASAPFPPVGLLSLTASAAAVRDATGAAELMHLGQGALFWAEAQGGGRTVSWSVEEVRAREPGELRARLERERVVGAMRLLARTVDARDPATHRHSERVADLACAIATQLGWTAERVAMLQEAALVHDVGKVGVPDAILFKPSRLTDEEYTRVKDHSVVGARIAAEALQDEQVAWVRGHHERWDGRGYPDGLEGENVPDGARIICVADSWDVMTVARPYSHTLTVEEAIEECRRCSGEQFWPPAVDAMVRLAEAGAIPPIDRFLAAPVP